MILLKQELWFIFLFFSYFFIILKQRSLYPCTSLSLSHTLFLLSFPHCIPNDLANGHGYQTSCCEASIYHRIVGKWTVCVLLGACHDRFEGKGGL